MRQKVSKERSQEGCAPLANPRHFLACPLRKFGPSPTPLRLCKTPVGVPSGTAEDGDSQSRDRFSPKLRPKLGRDFTMTGRSFAPAKARFFSLTLERTSQAPATKTALRMPVLIQPSRRDGRPTPPPYGPDCCWKTAIIDRASLRRPPRRVQLRCCSAGYGAVSEKQSRPTVIARAPWEIISDKLIVYRLDFLLRRGARDLRGLASGRPGRLLRQREPQQNTQWVRRGGAPTGRFTGHPGEKTPRTKNLSQPQTNPISSPPHTARNGS